MLEFAEDIAVDIPHIWTNLGVILGPAVNAEALPLCDLKTLVEPLIPGNKAGLLMAETLAAASRISVRISLHYCFYKKLRIRTSTGIFFYQVSSTKSSLQAFPTLNVK